jgi:hypothetical protein
VGKNLTYLMEINKRVGLPVFLNHSFHKKTFYHKTHCLKENEAGKNVQAHYFSNKNKIMSQKRNAWGMGQGAWKWSVLQSFNPSILQSLSRSIMTLNIAHCLAINCNQQ